MLRLIAVCLACLAPLPALAVCSGENLIEALPPGERAALDAAVGAHVYPEGNLWRAEKDGRTVHVVGTVHIPDPRLAPLHAEIAPILAEADVLVLETRSSEGQRVQRIMAEQPELAFLTEGPTMIDLLGEDLWAKVASELEARGIPPFLGAKFRPWLLGMTLAVPLCAMDELASGTPGLDGQLEAEAEAAGIEIATLDDIESLLATFAGGTIEEQVDMLRVMLMIEQDQAAAMATTLDSYFAGRHRELWEFSRLLSVKSGLDPEVFAEVEADLLDGRNLSWAPQIEAIVANRDAVIAVGAAHLSGETGVLRTLERLGYRLTRL